MKGKYIKWTKGDHLAFFKSKDPGRRSKWQVLREHAQKDISAEGRLRLEWIIFYHTTGKQHASRTAKHFGISRKTFHKWLGRFDDCKLETLEHHSRRPHRVRRWEVTPQQEARVIALRKKHLAWGKSKLKVRYEEEYGESISTWKIERVIREHQLFPDPGKHQKQVQKKRKRHKKPKTWITSVKLKNISAGTLWHTDAIIIYWYGIRRVIFTAIEHFTKLGYARVYNTNSSKNAKDFLNRLVYISDGDIGIVHHDNGSEFAGKFEEACQQMTIAQIYSRVRTPKDNAALERFNRTVQEEWLELSEVGLDEIDEGNQDLLEWLIEYNHVRPHAALDYMTPLVYAQQTYFDKVLPIWSARTKL